MATIILTANPAECTPGNTSENIVKFDPAFNDSLGSGLITAGIEIVDGTINFNTCGQPAANGASYTTAGTKFFVTFRASQGLSVKAASAADTFKISV